MIDAARPSHALARSFPTIAPSAANTEIQAFQELYDRRGQLPFACWRAEKNHRYAATSAKVIKNIDAHIRYLGKSNRDARGPHDQFVQKLPRLSRPATRSCNRIPVLAR